MALIKYISYLPIHTCTHARGLYTCDTCGALETSFDGQRRRTYIFDANATTTTTMTTVAAANERNRRRAEYFWSLAAVRWPSDRT